MNISILCIGDELLKGSTVNTNLADIGQNLLAIGVVPSLELTVPDERIPIHNALDFLLPLSDAVITIGGLGPTRDDVTRDYIAEYLKIELIENSELADEIRDYYKKRKRGEPPKRLLCQAMVPENGEVMPNNFGSAPGLLIPIQSTDESTEKKLFMLPGPPNEALPIFEESVIPKLLDMLKVKCFNHLFMTTGMPESMVEAKVAPALNSTPEISAAFCASPEGVKLFLRSLDKNLLEAKCAELRSIFGDAMLPEGKTLVQDVSERLRALGCCIATAESCTGGMLASAITDLPGSSDILFGSMILYSNECKIHHLGVDAKIINRYGAVSSECATDMAEKLANKFSVDAAVAITGIAGPGGGTPEKPVGEVHISTFFRARTITKKYLFHGQRSMVRSRSVFSALNQIRSMLLSDS